MRNLGVHPADLAHDLMLVLKVMPPHFTYYTPGWTLVDQAPPLPAMEQAAAQLYGGVLPTTITHPGATTTYSYLIATNRGDSYYGLYQFDPIKGTYTLLFPTGY
jgi:hypothetical protein